jgi:hypothetical protein
MEQLTIDECRSLNKEQLKSNDLWITGDGQPFPATQSGFDFASKWARKKGLAVHYAKKITPKPTSDQGITKKSKRK